MPIVPILLAGAGALVAGLAGQYRGSRSDAPTGEHPIVTARIHSDDHAVEGDFDVTETLERLSDKAIEESAMDEWSGVVADNLARETRSDVVDEVMTYLEIKNRRSRKKIGFEVSIDQGELEQWLQHRRPALYRRLVEKGLA